MAQDYKLIFDADFALLFNHWYNTNMLSEYIFKKLKEARYKLLKDGTYFGEIPGLRGVWANAKTLEDCREGLQSALEDWLLFKLKDGDAIQGLRIGVDRRRMVRTPAYAK